MTVSASLRRLPLFIAACLPLAAGSVTMAQDPSPASSAAPEAASSLPTRVPTGAWNVVAYDPWGEGLVEPLAGSSLTVVLLGDDRLEGDTVCGRFFGGYALDGESLSFGVASLGYDDCDQRQREESVALSAALDTVATWRSTESGLELLDESGSTRLVLVPDALEGPAGTWVVERYLRPNGRPFEAADGAPMSLTLEPNGRVSGSSGCRFFGGAWTSEGDGIAIGPVDPVGLPCEEAARRQERQLLRAIGESIRWERDGDVLRLIDAFGMPAVELRASTPAGDGDGDGDGDGA